MNRKRAERKIEEKPKPKTLSRAAQEAPPSVEVAPKVDVVPVVMGTYFAVQLLRGENVKDVANEVMQAAVERGRLFRKLQVMDMISVGAAPFVRFRSDLVDPQAVLASSGRGFITFSNGNYRVTFPDRQGGKFPTTIMCSTPKVGIEVTFAGPKVKRWAQQFVTPS